MCERLPVAGLRRSRRAGPEGAFPGPAQAWQAADSPSGEAPGTPSGEAPGTNLSQSAGGQACREGALRHILENDEVAHAGEGCS